MLVGTFNYKGHNYVVSAYDYGDSMTAYLSPVLKEDRKFLDNGIKGDGFYLPPDWEEMFVKVGSGVMVKM